MEKIFLVSAKHVSPAYTFDRTLVRVREHRNGWSASHEKLGYVCDFDTPHAAIRDLFGASACAITDIVEQVEPLPDLAAEYEKELRHRQLPHMSADELLHEDLSPEDRSYVSDFYRRWEATENYLAELREDIRKLDTGHDPDLVRELVAEYGRLNGAPPHGHDPDRNIASEDDAEATVAERENGDWRTSAPEEMIQDGPIALTGAGFKPL